MTQTTLTTKQAYFLKRIQEAEAAGQSITALAEQEQVTPALLYNYRYLLRAKGALNPTRSSRQNTTAASNVKKDTSFVPIAAPQTVASPDRMELKTQLPNGQPVWLSLSTHQLAMALAALSS
ncbi:MAG: hypothetical protein JXQ97_16510 [Natronospirillum sp.]